MTENTDANLAASALRGDAESFSRLCEQHYPVLVAVAYSRLADRNLAEDAAQEALLVAYRDVARLKQPQQFAGWLTAICRNIATDMARTRAREKHLGAEDCSPVANPSRNENDTVSLVREVIAQLEPGLREVIYLKYYNRLGYAQIAQVLGVSEEAVNGRLRRARDKVRRALQRRVSTETKP